MHQNRPIALLLAGLVLGLIGGAASCGSAQIPGDAAMFSAANVAEPTAVPTATPEPAPTALPAEPELPPVAASVGQKIDDDVATDAALGLIDVCSLYEDSQRLSELLGEFWALGAGLDAGEQCLWMSSKSSATSAVVSIALTPTRAEDDPGTPTISDSGEGLSITVDGNQFVVNVVTNDPDPSVADANLEEAERRIADDIFERMTGTARPEA